MVPMTSRLLRLPRLGRRDGQRDRRVFAPDPRSNEGEFAQTMQSSRVRNSATDPVVRLARDALVP